ncbi:hypothetical protein UUU_37200 [Klebsiella pneumoniae subsp. pneumoniae DSM 30104 = JCM 1662 = NBRC 14940]|uniref:Uncharacterized protein n=1 Tax=Klebsiella pneumoniae TaxID=573 RepID=A0A2X3CCM5_KLEPN|nr:hypothetical protein UUU_37200 [Klebsiella pneumoniae subsp. pneumoniae DSM 30104 = JCM 1662 = NBRC 14940]SQC14818.1 Uncharacterised protein [Klebsiella pneumoniae]
MPSAASAAGSISINEINSIIPAAKPREKPSRRLEGFWPITPNMAPMKVALPANSVNIKGDDIASLPVKIITYEYIA